MSASGSPNLPPTHDQPPRAARVYAENQIDHESLKRKLGQLIKDVETVFGQTIIKAERQHVRTILQTLRDDAEMPFRMITDITAVDNMRREDFEPARRFTVIYIVYSVEHKRRLRIECDVPEHDARIPSTVGIFKGGPWIEREVYDMFGIEFTGHPDLRRVLMPDYYEHFPLRKDYPLTGLGERDNFIRAEEVE